MLNLLAIVPGQVLRHRKALLFTDGRNTPNRVATSLMAALTDCADHERLAAIREERRENSRYASMRQCRMEVAEVEALYRRHQIPWLNSTNYSVEEIATKIMDIMGLSRRMY